MNTTVSVCVGVCVCVSSVWDIRFAWRRPGQHCRLGFPCPRDEAPPVVRVHELTPLSTLDRGSGSDFGDV